MNNMFSLVLQVPVSVYRTSKCVELQVPGLNEKRPALVRGDRIQLRLVEPAATNEEEDFTYEGIIRHIRHNFIEVGSFHKQ